MNHTRWPLWQYVKNYAVQFTATQLIATLVALPILISWGLGISVMTFVGNLIFAPLLSLFLLASSLLFFTELIGVPNQYVVSILEVITEMWHKLLSFGKSDWIVHFAKPHLGILLLIPILTFLVTRKKSTKKCSILILSILLAAILGGLGMYQKATRAKSLTLQINGKLQVERDNKGKITLVDSGFLNTKRSIQKYLEFDLQQQLVTNFGRNTVDCVKLLKPGESSMQTAIHFCKKGTVREIFLAFFEPFKSKRTWATFFELKRTAEEQKISITRPINQPKLKKKKFVQK